MAHYKQTWAPGHPNASSSGCVSEHILFAERALGHLLPAGAQVHHVDENRFNNANRNLVICHDGAFHKLLHTRARVIKSGGDPNTQRVCSTCRTLKYFAEFNRAASSKGDGLQSQCREGQRAYTKTYVRPSKRSAA